MSLNESHVEDAALEWFGELGYAIGHGAAFAQLRRAKPSLAPGEPATERDSFGEVALVGRLREAIRRLNSAIPEEVLPVRSSHADRRATIKRYLQVQIERRQKP
jgi:type I restriction enzyme R subunit